MFITAEGVNTHYQHIGKKGSYIVLLHGWGCTWEIWSPIIPLLSKHYQLIMPDLPSFGKSADPKESWDSIDYSKWLGAFINKTVQKQPCSLIGHSFGGKISAVYAATNPLDVKNLVIVDASGLPDPLSTSARVQEQVISTIPNLIKNPLSSIIKRYLSSIITTSHDYEQASVYQREVLKKILKERIDEHLKKIHASTLLLWGEHDLDTPLHQGKAFNTLIKHSRLEVLPTGHFPFVDQPQKFVDIVQEFIK